MPAGLDFGLYQNLDKAADWTGYLFIFIWAWRRPIRREITLTFALRTVGQALFFVTHDDRTSGSRTWPTWIARSS